MGAVAPTRLLLSRTTHVRRPLDLLLHRARFHHDPAVRDGRRTPLEGAHGPRVPLDHAQLASLRPVALQSLQRRFLDHPMSGCVEGRRSHAGEPRDDARPVASLLLVLRVIENIQAINRSGNSYDWGHCEVAGERVDPHVRRERARPCAPRKRN